MNTGIAMDFITSTRAQPNGSHRLFNAGQWTTDFVALEHIPPGKK